MEVAGIKPVLWILAILRGVYGVMGPMYRYIYVILVRLWQIQNGISEVMTVIVVQY